MIARLIERFYSELWEQGREDVALEVLHPSLTFRGSLGTDALDLDGYLAYLRSVRAGLSDYRCEILSLVTEEDKAAAQMKFSGDHTGIFLGKNPTHRHIAWHGAAFFEMREERLFDIWVLGDVKAVEQQLSEAT